MTKGKERARRLWRLLKSLWPVISVVLLTVAIVVALVLPLTLWFTLPDRGPATDTASKSAPSAGNDEGATPQPPPATDATARCREKKASHAAKVLPGAVDLETNQSRPTLAIALADRSSAEDSIVFATKGRKRLGDYGRRRVSAAFLEFPRRTPTDPFNGVVEPMTKPELGGTFVRLTVCVDRGARFKAGAFQGTVRIYGRRVSDFDYAVIITEKWPWQVAVATLWYAGLAFIVAAWLTQSLAFDKTRHGLNRLIAAVAGVVFGLIAMAPAFFGTYWNNATWGAEPWTHVSGLATAGFTAALAGLATAQKLIKKSDSSADDVAAPAEPIA
jgi:hypothetical protein